MLYHWCPTLFNQHNNKPIKLNKIMKPEQLMRSVSDQLQETCAGSSLGFRRKENEYDAAQDEKGGVGVWH
jgi:hypothetical protein